MAVHAQYPSNVLLQNRNEQERQEMEFPQVAHGFMDKSTMFYDGGGSGTAGNGNPRKRAWEAVAGVSAAPNQHKSSQPIGMFSAQPLLTLVSLDQLQSHSQQPAIVSTGLRLSIDDQNQNPSRNPCNPVISSSSTSLVSSILLSEELSAEIIQQKGEIDQFIRIQEEQLRRALAERRQRHYRVLLSAVEESATRRLREKDSELERATRRSIELEDRLAHLRAESMAWQTKAAGYQATAASLHAQLQHAAAATAAAPSMHTRAEYRGESPAAEDAESAYIDPNGMDPELASCRACRRRAATVVLLPCRHLCLCDACDAEAVSNAGDGCGGLAELCPICCCVRTGSVRVFLS